VDERQKSKAQTENSDRKQRQKTQTKDQDKRFEIVCVFCLGLSSGSFVFVFGLSLLSVSFVCVFCLGLLCRSFVWEFCLGLLSGAFVLVFCLGLLSWPWSLFCTLLQTISFMSCTIPPAIADIAKKSPLRDLLKGTLNPKP
jgi:hypothetical protein